MIKFTQHSKWSSWLFEYCKGYGATQSSKGMVLRKAQPPWSSDGSRFAHLGFYLKGSNLERCMKKRCKIKFLEYLWSNIERKFFNFRIMKENFSISECVMQSSKMSRVSGNHVNSSFLENIEYSRSFILLKNPSKNWTRGSNRADNSVQLETIEIQHYNSGGGGALEWQEGVSGSSMNSQKAP